MNACAAPVPTCIDFEGSAMAGHDLLHDRESQTGTITRRTANAVERSTTLVRSDSGIPGPVSSTLRYGVSWV